ncbi:hypothetical protein [Amycolatopsis jiangsuensis]|uniref:Uncharacterized protein n=1 Tax=Amycolatopsis jiangsuensis TaxID=1181879 RepID=A0A840IT68_9PSEU|nr:hypothetical protein [Amycolatopsis jiangsuensis]MBB4684348.1 hypothetical protein [Amycolatopsis jiangsuensis]
MRRAARLVFVAEDDLTARRRIEDVAKYFWARFTPPSKGWQQQVLERKCTWQLDDICAQLGWVGHVRRSGV